MVNSLGECGVLKTHCASGGEEVLLDVGGQDATEAFEDVGHSDEAREILEGLLVGDLKRQVQSLAPPSPPPLPSSSYDNPSSIYTPDCAAMPPFADIYDFYGVVARRPKTKQTSGPGIDGYEHTGLVGLGRRAVCDGVGGGSGGVCGV